MEHLDYDIVIGLEVHVELKTKSKIYCGCTTAFGGEANTHCCPICTGMPGTLPVLNKKVVEYGIKAGLATQCKIQGYSVQDRKQYFYPDLPKAYQTSQNLLPLCYDGYVDIQTEKEKKRIGITRIHIEEDAGKLIHTPTETYVDYNRCGVPLIEIVTEPDLQTPEDIRIFLMKLRSILVYTGISDCRMNEGSFRCDINVSVRKKGVQTLGTRTEMKNINSFNYAVKAAKYEAQRQIELIESGKKVVQETRRWDEKEEITVSMRRKEDAKDYRYFLEPDLRPIKITKEIIKEIQKKIPELPDERRYRYVHEDQLTYYDSDLLVTSMAISDYYDQATKGLTISAKKSVAHLIISEVFSRISEREKEEGRIPISPKHLGQLGSLIDTQVIHTNIARKVFAIMWDKDENPNTIIERENLKQIDDDYILTEMAQEVIGHNEKIVQDYLGGKEVALQALMGKMMAKTKGKANPKIVMTVLKERLKSEKF